MRSLPAVAAVALAQLVCVGAAVAPQLASRVAGQDYRLEVQPVDPIDPFRGAYVTLDYPGLRPPARREDGVVDGWSAEPGIPVEEAGLRGEVFVPLVEEDGLQVASEWTGTRPEQGPYLTCEVRSGTARCGIESFFVPQDRARELEGRLADGGVATVRIDDRGRASVVAVAG